MVVLPVVMWLWSSICYVVTYIKKKEEQDTRLDIGVCICATLYNGCIMECRDKLYTSHCVNSYTRGTICFVHLPLLMITSYISLQSLTAFCCFTTQKMTMMHQHCKRDALKLN